MIISRIISACIRALEFSAAIIVIGTNGTLLYIHHKYGTGPNGRLIYTICVAAVSSVISLVWLVPFTWTFMHYPVDIFISLAWFASFGALTNWIHRIDCERAFDWDGRFHGWACDTYRTNEAIVFLSAALWLISSFLSCWVFHTRNRERTKTTRADRERPRTANANV